MLEPHEKCYGADKPPTSGSQGFQGVSSVDGRVNVGGLEASRKLARMVLRDCLEPQRACALLHGNKQPLKDDYVLKQLEE